LMGPNGERPANGERAPQNFSDCVICQPIATQTKQNPVEKTTFVNADNHLPSVIRL